MKLSVWLAASVLCLANLPVFAATINFNISPTNLASLNSSGTCSGTWSYSGGSRTFTCSGQISFASGDQISTNTSSGISLSANAGITATNNLIGSSTNRISLVSSFGQIQIYGQTQLFGTIQTESGGVLVQGTSNAARASITGNISSEAAVSVQNLNQTGSILATYGSLTLTNTSLSGSLTTSGTGSVSSSSIGGAVSIRNGITSSASQYSSTVTVTNGTLNTSNSTYNANVTISGSITTNNDVFLADITSTNGALNLTGGSVTGMITTPCCTLTTNNTNLAGGATVQSGISITGGTISGDYTMTSNNPAVVNNVTMTSGSITSASTVTINNSTLGSDTSPVLVTSVSGSITVNNSQVYGDLVTPDYDKVYVNGSSEVVGSCIPVDEPLYACGGVATVTRDSYWRFDEVLWNGTSGEVKDSSLETKHGRAVNGAVVAQLFPSPASCTYGDFQAVGATANPFVDIARNSYFHDSDEFGFTLWLKMSAAAQASGSQTIMAYGGAVSGVAGRFQLTRESGGNLRFSIRMTGGTVRFVETSGTAIFNDQWQHIAFSYSKDNRRMRLYVNNQLVDDVPNNSIGDNTNAKTPNDGTGNLAIGALPDGTTGIRGQIDEVRFYDRELRASDIKTMYEQVATCVSECFTENFSNDTNWYLTQRNSTPPSLRTSPNRLRLTENTINQATSITFKRSFPAAGNKMTIEFDHYAYGGSGADGIALVLSDAAVTPVPGSYGGSLGYAQRTNVSPAQNGFAGGWLGIGFDEFGNFSQATEGRVGGTTARPQAIGVRAASSTNYGWLGGTNTLSPTLSATGSTLARGDRYRITIDSRISSPQTVSFQLERRLAGGSSYSTLLTSSNLLSLGQPAPPANLLLSYTGSTGDNTNFHEITNIQVCTQKPSTPVELGSQLHHIELSYPASPLTCNPTEVTIKACANASCSELYTSPVTVNLAAVGGSWSGGNSVTFTGSVTKSLIKTTAGSFTLAVTSSSVTPTNSVQCLQNGISDDCIFTVADSGFVFNVQDMIANQSQNVVISAVRKDNSSQQCVPAFASVTKAVKLWSDYIDPVASGRPESRSVLVNTVAIAQNSSSAVTQNLSFNSNGQATIALNYTDAGQMQLNARYDGSVSTGDSGLLMTGADQFVARPAGICIQEGNGSAAPISCASPYNNCNAFKKAGENFNLSVIAKASANNGDTNICANPISTPNFKLNSIALSRSLVSPLVADGANLGLLGVSSYNHVQSAGGVVTTAQTVSEVGVYTFTATPGANSYFGYTIAPATSAPVGRFIPAYFTAAVNTPVLAACNSASVDPAVAKFAYLGQPLGYQIFPRATLTAKNVQNQPTLNYGLNFFKAQSMAATTATAMQSATNYSTLSIIATPSTVSRGKLEPVSFDNYDGSFDLVMSDVTTPTASPEQLSFARSLPYSSPILSSALGLTLNLAENFVKDSDGVCVKTTDNTACLPVSFSSITAPELRYGRLRLTGGSVPESHPVNSVSVPVSLSAEYWNGSAFVINSADNCSLVNFTNLIVESGLGKSGVAGQLTAGLSEDNSLLVQIPANTQGTWPVFYQAPNWLKFDWLKEPVGQPLVLENPSSEVSVGRFRGNKRQIFWQERLN